MSSLAGALISPEMSSLSSQAHNDNLYDNVVVGMKTALAHPDPEANNDEEDEEMTDLFGADGEVENATREDRHASVGDTTDGSERLGSAEADQRRALEYEEDEVPPELAIEEREANVAFPNLPVPSSSDNDNWVIRLPNFVKMDSKPFHPDTYIGPEQEDDDAVQQAETLREKSMSIKLKVENTIRWRWVKDEYDGDRRQSNSRIIRWSDGTMSLRLGKELFDINKDIDTSGAIPRQLGGSQSQSQSQQPPSTPAKSHGLTYLVAQHKRSQVLQSETVITGYMSLRPTGMQSETHRMLVRAVGQKHNKVARLRLVDDPSVDPEKEKAELMKTAKKTSKRRSNAVDYLGGRSSRKSYGRKLETSDLEQSDEDEEGGGMSARKRKNRNDDESGGQYQRDGFVVEDESEEDGDFVDSRKRRRDEEEDPLDKLDAKIQRQQNKRRQGSDDSDVAEQVESEEEEEQKVRRAGASRRRQALYDEDEDE
ncbi:Leo1-like protein-domain-containing protein [Lentinula guzmanii]|uniref:Leo1-like protein-domain-containing protein n=1 Tax=Lentinula guzmanii TaxID=2804957 RepID=A0AA38JIT9_9AGAR|nr:Leo1-like protein-domain-containing protein [Lentinula guzmanii]